VSRLSRLGTMTQPLGRLSRRVRVLAVGGVLFLVLLVLAVTLPVPYVILSPGPTLNTLGKDDQGNEIIVIKGHETRAVDGHLNLTTVDVSTASVTIFQALDGWLQHDKVVVPRDSIYPPGQSQQQVNQQDTQDFVDSQDFAEAAAFCELGYPKGVAVDSFTAGSKAKGVLQANDQLISIDGTPVTTTDALTALLAKQTPGTDVTVVVSRAGNQQTVQVPLISPAAGQSGARMGIAVVQGCIAPFSVDLGLANEIGGPSAGMMFALGIIQEVGATDLTGGKFIAGTGTIDANGNVGPIGGIQLKMIAARKAGATYFLTPAGNCADVVKATPKGLTIVKVDTLHSAVTDLLAIKAGQSVPHC
jgi:PDZ domain-containing protein